MYIYDLFASYCFFLSLQVVIGFNLIKFEFGSFKQSNLYLSLYLFI